MLWGEDVQDSAGKNTRDVNLLSDWYVQVPDWRYWNDQNRKVGQDVKEPSSLIRHLNVEAVATFHQRIPDLFSRNTCCDGNDGDNQIEDDYDTDRDVNCKMEG